MSTINFYDVMPPFVLGVENATGFGDFGSFGGSLPVASAPAWSIHGSLAAAGFDLSLSLSLTVDHGIVQSYQMITGGTDLPLVPLVVNTAAVSRTGCSRTTRAILRSSGSGGPR